MQEISVSVMDYGFCYTANSLEEKVIDATKIDVIMKMPTPSPYFKQSQAEAVGLDLSKIDLSTSVSVNLDYFRIALQ